MRLVGVRQALGSGANAAPTIAFVALIMLGGWLAARWVVYFASRAETPGLASVQRVQLEPIARALADGHLFGVAGAGPGGTTVSTLNVKLKGVFAGGDSSVAIFSTGGPDEAKRVGAELAPGVVLESVHARHVVLNRNGSRERVNLEERVSGPVAIAAARPRAAPTPAPAPPVAVPAPAAPTGAAPVGATRSGPGAGFQRPEPYAPVGDVATEPPPAPVAVPTPPLVSGSTQGLVIQSVPSGSMLERLGLQPGDVVRSVNGERVTSEADVARILQNRGIQGSFTAEVQRGGTTIPLAVGGQR